MAIGAAAVAAWNDYSSPAPLAPVETSSEPTPTLTAPSPEILREAEARTAKAEAERAVLREHNQAVAQVLEQRSITLDTGDVEAWLEADTLVEIVMNAVGADVWDDGPASIETHHHQLILFQTQAMHEAVDDVLAKLRISRARSLKDAEGR